jgi:RND family efflux transporter MFP subunit
LKKIAFLIILGLLFAACKNAPGPQGAPAEPPVVSVTRWSEKTELFLEHPPLVAGEKVRFAVHLTELGRFAALTEGKVIVELRAPDGAVEAFRTEGPSRPGIFGVDVTPGTPGVRVMTVRLESPALDDLHDVGEVQVFVDAGAARPAAGPEDVEAVSFLKEQQWTLDFATQVVTERSIHGSLRVPAEVRPRTGGEAQVVAPVAGRLGAGDSIPGVGFPVQAGQVLAWIVPRAAAPADRASLELAVEEAKTAWELARRDRERVERLAGAGAVPGKRLDEARAAEDTAQARLKAGQARLAQHDFSRDAESGTRDTGGHFALRAPISGVLAASRAAPGAFVEEGQSLFRVVATDPVHVVAFVPEAEAWRLRGLSGGELELAGMTGPVPLGRVISTGRVVEPEARTLPVVFEVRNPDAGLAVGQSVHVRLFVEAETKSPAVPETAIVDDAGRSVVFAQVAGESFLRRPVRLGGREKGYVQVLEGLRLGERVVTAGAYQIRLASLSPRAPAHGHVH